VERELREETGYAATKFYPLPPWPYRSGTSENVMYGYIATGLKKVTNDAGDATEDITVMEVPAEKLMEFWLHPEKDVLFQPEILAMYQAALELGIIKLR
jgi:8-oxo-dGTP pyrophosphatase MutT (NUDIX family)